jgi:hypothetical protein
MILFRCKRPPRSTPSPTTDIARAASLYSTLANFLNNKRWGKERADEFRRKAKANRTQHVRQAARLAPALTAPEPSAPAPRRKDHPETWGRSAVTDFSSQASSGSTASIFSLRLPPGRHPGRSIHWRCWMAYPTPNRATYAPVSKLDTTGLDEDLSAM